MDVFISHVAKFADSAGSISKHGKGDNLLCYQQVLGLQPHRAHPKTEQSEGENVESPVGDKNALFHFAPDFSHSSVPHLLSGFASLTDGTLGSGQSLESSGASRSGLSSLTSGSLCRGERKTVRYAWVILQERDGGRQERLPVILTEGPAGP